MLVLLHLEQLDLHGSLDLDVALLHRLELLARLERLVVLLQQEVVCERQEQSWCFTRAWYDLLCFSLLQLLLR